ncbi:DUF3566 domain-containing protein [Pseudactinotalea sp. Z1732]|uniref:DUF3566 domain-containing protein n=2 Tax=Micrococcales TaxID=85006 RepID=UPI003C7D1A4C
MSDSSGTTTGPVRTTAFPHTATAKVQGGSSSRPNTATSAGSTSRPQGSRPRDPGARTARPAGRGGGPRRVRLAVSRVDPWSVMKLAFLMSIAIGIGIVIATAVIWWVLNQMEVFAQMRGLLEEAEAMAQFGPLLEYLEFSRVMSVATVIAIVDIALLTALATLGAFIYNIVAAMVGGLHLTLTDD